MKKVLEVVNIKKYFGGIKAVDGCSFKVIENTITSLIGPNGAGKTTLFDIINGMNQADEGKIIFNKQDITEISIHKRANLGMARTFQQVRLFKNLTIKENLLLAKKDAADEELHNILNMVYLNKHKNTLAGSLSFGQQRLLEIARALLTNFDIILMDEPTAGVNPLVRRELKNILINIKKQGKTVFLIEHDMDFVMDISDEVIVLNYGKLLKIGKPSQIVKDKEVLEAYLGEENVKY